MMAPCKRQLKATRHLICGSCSNWVDFVKSGCEKSWAEVQADSFSFECRGCTKMKELEVELEELRLLVVAMVGREQGGCASSSGGGTVDDKVGKDTRDARESSPQPGRKLRGGKVTGRRETGRKETGRKGTGGKTTGAKERGVGETGGKEKGVGETGGKEKGVGETGGKTTGVKEREVGETRAKEWEVGETGAKETGGKGSGQNGMEGIERKSYSAAVIEGVRKRARVFVGDSIVRKTDRVLNKGDDVVVCLPGAKIEAITERVKNIVGSDGNPIDVIKNVIWRNVDKTLSSGRYHVSGRNLKISSLNHTLDDGNYSCAAENEAGMGDFRATFELLVNFKPTVSVMTPDVVEGQSVTIRCRSQARPAVNSVMWKKGQQVIRVTTDTKYDGGTVQNPSLTINPVMRTDGGQYTCQLSNEVGQGYKSVTLEVLSSWFTWHKQNSDFSRNTTGMLSVTPSSVDESGEFSCVAGNWIGQSDNSDWATVTVQAPAKVEYPNYDDIIKTPAYNDPQFKMTCTVSGSGDVKAAWLKDGEPVVNSDFAVTSVQVTDGQYMYGQTDAKNNEAHWSSGPTLTAAAPNETSKEIICSVCASPQPHFQWTFNNETLREGIHVAGDRIILDLVERDDFGVYQCITTNSINGENRTAMFGIKLVESASPQVTLKSVKLEEDRMTVKWSYNGQSLRRKRSTSNVSVVIYYQPDGGEEAHYPLDGSVAAEERQVTINGQFDDKVKYKVWLKVYEGLLDVSFQQTKPFGAAVKKSGINVQQPAIAMNEDFRQVTNDMTNQYQSLTSSADISPNQGTYTRLSKPDESANLPTPGPTYEEIGAGGLTKHSYVNASISCDDGAEYSEVKETATPQEQPTYQNITT
ncbi:hypothetical protein LSAT2_026088 [Lamellibrachia satsuma]|nr:hypothetical protein LSAT2_026088 [Lamellibrachia satsuma]